MQAEKGKLEEDLAAVQVKLDTREVQYQDAVRQLNISKFMLSESDEARDEVSHRWNVQPKLVGFATKLCVFAGAKAEGRGFSAESKAGIQRQRGKATTITIT